jgi:DNA-binding NtrC family response regulator
MAALDRTNDSSPLDDEHASREMPGDGAMLGDSPALRTLYEQIARVARTDAPVLLVGESGTGKELAASRIHALSRRREGPFLAVNCGAISPTLIDSELFGRDKGTGTDRVHRGYFERAHRGTLFLDEIGELPAELQAKLLRVLETGILLRAGSPLEVHTDVRVISATNRDPSGVVAEKRLRTDLYHRLAVFPLQLPPLRQRGSDVRMLAVHFLHQLNAAHGTRKAWSPAALERMKAHPWPGNVRELRNYVERAYILSDGMLDAPVSATPPAGPTTANNVVTIPVGTSLEEACRALILATLERCGGVRKHAAQMLGISLKTLYNKLARFGLPPNRKAAL